MLQGHVGDTAGVVWAIITHKAGCLSLYHLNMVYVVLGVSISNTSGILSVTPYSQIWLLLDLLGSGGLKVSKVFF